MNKQLLDLYSDYLISSFNQTTATGLSKLLDGSVSHDKISRFLAERKYTSKDLWKEVKSTIRQIESDTAVLILDDTIQEKPYSDENELICWHYDHSTGRTMKGINIHLTCTAKDIETIYKKRWSIEVFHKTIKSNTALAKSPTKVPLTQGNHVFMSIYSAFKLECLSLKYKMNHFALKAKLYMTVIRQAFDQLRSLW